jgi:zinc D-Ala-D-Ala carboxypeptidase|tara:strand:- start:595 stop:1050 length:456 start_codon:yes stop_codon:yes gene_type:complete
MRISKNISYRESIHSNTAKRRGIDNSPKAEHIDNMRLVAEKVFEPLREWVGGPIKVNSFYRSEATNRAVGGTGKSQHCKGQAIDIDDVFGHKTNAEMFHYIKDNLEYDQIIWEFGDEYNPNWIHISYDKNNNRNRALRAVKKGGRTKYELF